VKTKNDNYDVLKELRKIRKKHYEETKNMSPEERREYYHSGAKRVDEAIARMNYKDGKKRFSVSFS
jgi:hypothetical protein